jgi:hypothetical protein
MAEPVPLWIKNQEWAEADALRPALIAALGSAGRLSIGEMWGFCFLEPPYTL